MLLLKAKDNSVFVITSEPIESQLFKSPYFSINYLGTQQYFRKGSTEVPKQVALAVKQVIKMLYKATTHNGNVVVNDIVFE